MPSKAVLDAVRARVVANFTSCDVLFPNEAKVSPGLPVSLDDFVQVEFPIGMSERFGIEFDSSHQETGVIRFVVHVKPKGGFDAAVTYADALAAVFRSVRFSGVECSAPSPLTPLGDSGAYYRASFAVPYVYFYRP